MGALDNIYSKVNLEDFPYPKEGYKYISESMVAKALKSGDFSELESCVVIPSQSEDVEYVRADAGETLFSSNIWSSKHLIRKHNETYRSICFDAIESEELRREAKWVCASILWWARDGRKGAKLSSTLRNFENIVICYRILESLNYKSIFWLNREPVAQAFREEINSDDRSQRSTKNLLISLSALCDFQFSEVGKLGFHLDFKPVKKLLKSEVDDTNQVYAMPYRIMMAVWDGLVTRVERWKVFDEGLLTDLVLLYREFEEWFEYTDTSHKEHAMKMLFRDKQDRIKQLKERSKGSFLEDIFYVSTQDRWEGNTFINFKELVRAHERMTNDCLNCIQCMSGMRFSETRGLFHSSLKVDHDVVVFKSWLQKWAEEGGKIEEWAAADFAGEAFRVLANTNKALVNKSDKEMASVPINLNMSKWLVKNELVATVSGRHKQWTNTFCEEFNIQINEEDLREFKLLNPNLNNPDKVFEEICVGGFWPLRTHQYRRSIAVHTKRLNLASGNDRNWQFKQITQKVTDWYESYCPEDVIPKQFVQAMVNADIEQSAATSVRFQTEGKLIGKGGKELMKQRDKPEKLQMFPNIKVAMSQVKRRKSKLSSLGNGFYCMNGFGCDFKSIVQSASCNTECPSMVANEESIPFWKEQYERYSKLLKTATQANEPLSTLTFFELELEFYKEALKEFGELDGD